jgi:hypothetical protein
MPITSVPVPSKLVITATEQGSTVLVDLQGGRYYGLNAIAARIWGLLTEGASRPLILATIAKEHELSEADVDSALETFAEQLTTLGLASAAISQ